MELDWVLLRVFIEKHFTEFQALAVEDFGYTEDETEELADELVKEILVIEAQ